MANTTFEDVYDLFLILVKDYNLNSLYNSSATDFSTYLQGFLIISIPDFDNCIQDLTNYDLTNATFNFELSLTEQVILAKLMVIQWLTKEIQNITQMNNFLSDTDFKMFSNSQNLREKSTYKDKLKEEINQEMLKYGLKNTPWDNWNLGVFS